MTNEMIIHIGGLSIELHMSVLLWLIVGLFVTILLCWAGTKFKKADPREAPKGVVLVFEQLVDLCMNVLKANLTNKTWKYLPFMGTVMIMMVISNLLGLLGLQSPTSNLTLDLVLVMMMIVLIHGTDIRLHGIIGKLKGWCEPIAFLFPLNVIGDLAFPVSLTLRLFGNMLGGTVVVTLLYMLVKAFMPFTLLLYTVTPFLHMYFDIFTAFMQTYIFFTLASYFLGESCDREEV